MRKTRGICLLLAGIISLMGCSTVEPQQQEQELTTCVDDPREGVIQQPKEVSSALLKNAVNGFGYDFYKNAVEKTQNTNDKNIFLSPYSIVLAFAMLDHGASGNTKSELEQVLQIDDLSLLDEQVKAYIETTAPGNTKLQTANAIWYQTNREWAKDIDRSFLKPIKEYYNGDAFETDFNQENKKTLDMINKFISENTDGMIDPYLESIDSDTVMALFNTVYFYGEWSRKFMPQATADQTFYGIDKEAIVPMMNMNGEFFRYLNKNGLSILELPYGESNGTETSIVMDILIADDDTQHTSEVFAKLTREEKENLWNDLDQTDSAFFESITIPKFSMEYKVPDMIAILENMGIKDAFTEGIADFSNIGDNLYVSSTGHMAKIEVDEEGSRAAAVTDIGINESSLIIEETPLRFQADRPFVFVIRDTNTGILLFMGEVNQLL